LNSLGSGDLEQCGSATVDAVAALACVASILAELPN
jgi:hypothetical protein